MMPSGPPAPIGGPQSNHPLLRTNSGLLGGGQQGSIPSQSPFTSLVPHRNQFNGNGLVGNISNVSSLNHSFANGGPASISGLPAPPVNLPSRGGLGGVDIISTADVNPLLFSSNQVQGQQHFQNSSNNQPQTQQLETIQNMQQQFPVPQSQQQLQQHQQQQHVGGVGNVGAMVHTKLESQMGPGDHNGPMQQLQSLRSIGTVKMEPQQLQALRSLGPVKMEPQHPETSLFMQQQQQQQNHQQILLSRQNSQSAVAHMSLLQQQRILQLQQQQKQQQQQQQQHMIKDLSQQRSQLQQNLAVKSPVKPNTYEPGTCARRLTHYMYHQQHRPEDNNIEFWKKFVAEYFAPNAKKRWCVSLYGSGRQTTGVFPQDVWHCEICNRKPGRGFETTVEVLPRLCQIKYASGTLDELLYVDMPREYQNASGQIVLDYAKAIQESVFEQLRVVRDGQLRIVFNPDLKIASWEFCARRHEELIPRRLIIPQVSQLGAVVQKYQAAAQSSSSVSTTQDLQSTCNSFVASARQLAKALEVPLVNDLGYTKRYVRCLQISEVVNCMKDLIDYSRESGSGPMDSLVNFPRRTLMPSGLHTQPLQQPEEPQNANPASNNNIQVPVQGSNTQFTASSNGMVTVPLIAASTSTSSPNLTGLLNRNSMNVLQENKMSLSNSSYGGARSMQIPSAGASNSLLPTQLSPSTFVTPAPSVSNDNPLPSSHNTTNLSSVNSPASLSIMQQSTPQPHEADPMDSQSSVQLILQEMMSSQLNGMNSLRNDMKDNSGITQGPSGGALVRNGISTDTIVNGTNFTGVGGVAPSAASSAIRAAISNNIMPINGRLGVSQLSQDHTTMIRQQQDIGNRLLGGLGSVNSFNNIQFDWKPST